MAKTTDFTNFSTEYPNYFPGQYLLEEDFELQHKYLSDRQRYYNQSLHVSGIIEGLEVEAIHDRQAVRITSGSAINNLGELIVLKADLDFSNFQDITNGELYIQYSEEKQVKQQEDVADSYTRWSENPLVGFAATTPDNAVKLATLTIADGKITVDASSREYSGLSFPNSNGEALTLRSGGSANPNLAVLTGSLKIDGDLTINGVLRSGNSSGALQVDEALHTTGSLRVDGDVQIKGVMQGNLHLMGNTIKCGGNFGSTRLRIEATDNTKQPATTAALELHGYAGRGKGLYISDMDVPEKWFIGEGYDYRGIGIGYNNEGQNTERSQNAKLYINPEGQVGIGTTKPAAKLHVTGGGSKFEQEPWEHPTIEGGWSDDYNEVGSPVTNQVGYYKDSMGIVHLQGGRLFHVSQNNRVIFQLEEGYQTQFLQTFIVHNTELAPIRIEIKPTGEVSAIPPYPRPAGAGTISLDGITFRARGD
ncbi:MAG: hypothetical protein QNJ55_31780 [Xenococcus sp. MO_188.B8]|nr:hypothetical protein [Xenococcus sp. MO_188.B8]